MAYRDTPESFVKYRKDYRDIHKDRQRVLSKEWRERNRLYHYAQHNCIKRVKKLKAVEYLGGKCAHCKGVFHHTAYDFHHLDPSKKEMPVATLLGHSWVKLKKELDKCILLCSNCHRIHHYDERQIDISKLSEKQRAMLAKVGSRANIKGAAFLNRG